MTRTPKTTTISTEGVDNMQHVKLTPEVEQPENTKTQALDSELGGLCLGLYRRSPLCLQGQIHLYSRFMAYAYAQ